MVAANEIQRNPTRLRDLTLPSDVLLSEEGRCRRPSFRPGRPMERWAVWHGSSSRGAKTACRWVVRMPCSRGRAWIPPRSSEQLFWTLPPDETRQCLSVLWISRNQTEKNRNAPEQQKDYVPVQVQVKTRTAKVNWHSPKITTVTIK